MDTIELSKKMLNTEADVLHKLADQIGETFLQGAGMLANCKGHIIASGVGTTGMVARRFAHLLCNVGCPALFLHSGDSLHGSSGAIKGEDVLFLLSKTGETKVVHDGKITVRIPAQDNFRLGKMPDTFLALVYPDVEGNADFLLSGEFDSLLA